MLKALQKYNQSNIYEVLSEMFAIFTL